MIFESDIIPEIPTDRVRTSANRREVLTGTDGRTSTDMIARKLVTEVLSNGRIILR